MKLDKSTGIAVLGVGAVALYALTRKQKSYDLRVFPDAWSGGSATPATPPTTGITPATPPTTGITPATPPITRITPIINFPEVPPYVEQRPPERLFSPPMPYIDYAGGASTHKKDTVTPATYKKDTVTPATYKKDTVTPATYTTGDPIHPSIGSTGGFGGGGAGGRGGSENNLLGDVQKTLFSPLALVTSATPFGAVATTASAGLAVANTLVSKKDDKIAAEKTAFDVATDSTTSVAYASGSSASVAGSSKKTVSAPADDIAGFFTAGRNYGSATVVGQSSAGTVYQHSGGARSVVSRGQIVASSSRALDAADIARLPKKMAAVLGY